MKLEQNTDSGSDDSTCSLVADTRPKIVIDNVTHFMDGPLLSLSNVLDHAATAGGMARELAAQDSETPTREMAIHAACEQAMPPNEKSPDAGEKGK